MTTEHCGRCGHTWRQSWYDPPACPRCDDKTDEELADIEEERQYWEERKYDEQKEERYASRNI